MSSSDLELLARYARQGAEDAFAEVVRRHAGLVYTTALRVTRSPQLAEEVAQAVFVDLARNAAKPRPDTVLTAWLYFSARRIAANTVRGESRRLIREQTAYAMNAHEKNSPPPVELEPLLDDAIDALAESDRTAIMLRFFEDKSLADVGAALGVSADAAQKRVSRAVEQMRGFFTHRGIATGTVAVTALLTANTAKAVPAGLAASICASVHSTIPLTTAATLIKTATMTALQKSLVGLTLVTAVGVAVRQTHEVSQLREQLQTSTARASHAFHSETVDSTPARSSVRREMAKAGGKLTGTQLEVKLKSLAEMGIDKFGRANMYQLIAETSLEDIPRMLALVDEQIPGELRQRFHEAWIERWVQADPAAAFAYVKGIKGESKDGTRRDLYSPAMKIVLANWANQDPAAARNAVETDTSPYKAIGCKILADTLSENDPKGTLEWFIKAEPKDYFDYEASVAELGRKWSAKDPAEAWKWALALPDGEQKSRFMGMIAQYAANASPLEVANDVSKMPPGKAQNIAANIVAASWANTDPRAASEWAAQFPDPEFRSLAIQAIAVNWMNKDLAAAKAWVQSLPAGDDQQQALLGMTQKLTDKRQPEQAAILAASLTDPEKRKQSFESIGHRWSGSDPAAARQWMQSVGFSEEQITQIQNKWK